jgi:hypothetical protein
MQAQIDKVESSISKARETAAKKSYAALEAQRSKLVISLRAFMTSKEKSAEGLFQLITGDADSTEVSKKKLVSFCAESLSDFPAEEKARDDLFKHLAAGEEASLTKDQFLELLRLVYKVIKPTVLTESLSIKSKAARRLEVGEVLEAVEGPIADDSLGVERVKCKCTRDGAIGWVTLAGNQGTKFLELGGNCMTCVKETSLTESLAADGGATLRSLSKGEVLEVLEASVKDEASGQMRIKGRSRVDGSIGWATVEGEGVVFLEST